MKAVSRDMCRLAWATSICLNSISIACEVDRKVGSQPGWREPRNYHASFHQAPCFWDKP